MNSFLNPNLAANPMAAMGMNFNNPLMMPTPNANANGVMFPGMMGGMGSMQGMGAMPGLGGPMDMSQVYNQFMMPFMPNQIMPTGSGNVASFHQQGPKNEIKLFVGGLQYQTGEQDMFAYFS